MSLTSSNDYVADDLSILTRLLVCTNLDSFNKNTRDALAIGELDKHWGETIESLIASCSEFYYPISDPVEISESHTILLLWLLLRYGGLQPWSSFSRLVGSAIEDAQRAERKRKTWRSYRGELDGLLEDLEHYKDILRGDRYFDDVEGPLLDGEDEIGGEELGRENVSDNHVPFSTGLHPILESEQDWLMERLEDAIGNLQTAIREGWRQPVHASNCGCQCRRQLRAGLDAEDGLGSSSSGIARYSRQIPITQAGPSRRNIPGTGPQEGTPATETRPVPSSTDSEDKLGVTSRALIVQEEMIEDTKKFLDKLQTASQFLEEFALEDLEKKQEVKVDGHSEIEPRPELKHGGLKGIKSTTEQGKKDKGKMNAVLPINTDLRAPSPSTSSQTAVDSSSSSDTVHTLSNESTLTLVSEPSGESSETPSREQLREFEQRQWARVARRRMY